MDEMKSIEKYADLIKALPVGGQFTRIKKDGVWRRFANEIPEIRDTVIEILDSDDSEAQHIKISRDDIKKESNVRKKIVKILMWGYPGGGRGRNVQNILNSLDALSKNLQFKNNKDKNFDSVKDAFKAVKKIDSSKEIDGLGLSTISKFLYFFNKKINNIPCQIYDKKVIDSLKENHQIEELSERNNWDRKDNDYKEYIELLFNLSATIECSPDQIELFLFMINNSFDL